MGISLLTLLGCVIGEDVETTAKGYAAKHSTGDDDAEKKLAAIDSKISTSAILTSICDGRSGTLNKDSIVVVQQSEPYSDKYGCDQRGEDCLDVYAVATTLKATCERVFPPLKEYHF